MISTCRSRLKSPGRSIFVDNLESIFDIERRSAKIRVPADLIPGTFPNVAGLVFVPLTVCHRLVDDVHIFEAGLAVITPAECYSEFLHVPLKLVRCARVVLGPVGALGTNRAVHPQNLSVVDDVLFPWIAIPVIYNEVL